MPHIIYDGIKDDKRKNLAICIRNNKNQSIANIKAANNFKDVSRDMTPYDCSGTSQEKVKFVTAEPQEN